MSEAVLKMPSPEQQAPRVENSTAEALTGSCPLPISHHEQIILGHGSGGKLTEQLIERLFLPAFSNPLLDKLDDQAVLQINGSRLAFTTDSFVVTPIFFPGGDIGHLAVNGTVNDLAMSGAKPLYLAAAFILEEGLPINDLRRIIDSMSQAAKNAGVQLVTGDTKVVNRGKGDKVFIATTGIGVIEKPVEYFSQPRPTRRQGHPQRLYRRSRHGDSLSAREPGIRRSHRKRLCRAAHTGR